MGFGGGCHRSHQRGTAGQITFLQPQPLQEWRQSLLRPPTGQSGGFCGKPDCGDGNGFVYFDLSTPKSPQLKTATKINKAAFEEPAYAGNAAFVPTIGYQSFGGAVTKQFGDVVAVDVTSFDKPAVVGALEQQTDPVAGGAYNVFGATSVNNNTIYVAT